MNYRSRIEILYAILKLANKEQYEKDNKGIKLTRILYGSYLSYNQFKDYMPYLVNNELLEVIESELHEKRYLVTAKGLRFLDLCEQMSEVIPELRR